MKWDGFWQFSFSTFCTNKTQETTWFLRHYTLCTGDKVKKMFPSSNPICKSCNKGGTEDILHAFATCRFVKPIWRHFAPIFQSILLKSFEPYQLTLGTYVSEVDCNSSAKLALTLTCIINKYVWWQRNKNHYDCAHRVAKIQSPITIRLINLHIRRVIISHFKAHKVSGTLRRFTKNFCIRSALCSLTPQMDLNINLS